MLKQILANLHPKPLKESQVFMAKKKVDKYTKPEQHVKATSKYEPFVKKSSVKSK